jgi:hypothetical protein
MDSMQKYIALILCLTINSIVLSQKNDFDYVFLKGGKTIQGIIIEQIPFQSMKIVTLKKDTLVFPIEKVERISRKSFMESQNIIPSEQNWGQLILESGITVSLTDTYSNFLKLNLIGLYRIYPKTSAGIGTGLRYHMKYSPIYTPEIDFSPLFNNFGVPFFVDVRTVFSKKKVSGFAALDLGYSFDLSDDPVEGIYYFKQGIFSSTHIASAGFLISPTIGITWVTSEKSALNLGLAFETHFYRDYWEYSFIQKSPSVSAGILIGFSFR